MSRHVSFSERRRASLRKQVDRLELLEIRNTITEPISVLGLSLSAYSGLNRLGIADLRAMSSGLSGLTPAAQAIARGGQQTGNAAAPPTNFVPIAIIPWTGRHAAAGGGAGSEQDGPAQASQVRVESGDAAATGTPAAASDGDQTGISSPWRPVSQPGGGAAMPPRGGSGGLTPTKAASRAAGPSASLPASTPAASGAGGSAALLAAAAGSAGGGASAGSGSMPRLAPPGSLKHGGAGGGGTHGGTGASSGGSGTVALVSSGPTVGPGSIPDPTLGNGSGPSQETFTYFPLYVLDVNNGVVLFPGVDQQATLRASVILQAQVSGTTVSTYNWNTSGISSDATSIAGASTYQLSFRWTNETTSAHVDPVTLSVTDTNSHIETYTYDFALPLGSVSNSGGGGNATWPQSLSPDTVSPADPAWASDGVSVDSNSGSLDTSIPLPSYNPNVPALALTYDSVSANPMPIIVAENTLSASAAVPSQVGATLTFNSTVGTTYYYNTSSFNPGDVQQIALQATGASSLATGRYAYSMQIVDYGTTNTTITLSGTATLLNESGSAFGDGWVLDGLEKITSASGGVILDLGGGGSSLWFAGSFGSGGGTYTDPPGEFSTLVKNSNGSYTDTLTDGTQINFNSGGYEIATVDLNNSAHHLRLQRVEPAHCRSRTIIIM